MKPGRQGSCRRESDVCAPAGAACRQSLHEWPAGSHRTFFEEGRRRPRPPARTFLVPCRRGARRTQNHPGTVFNLPPALPDRDCRSFRHRHRSSPALVQKKMGWERQEWPAPGTADSPGKHGDRALIFPDPDDRSSFAGPSSLKTRHDSIRMRGRRPNGDPSRRPSSTSIPTQPERFTP
jgi:hypothetical protein